MAKTLYIIDGHAHIYAAYFAPMTGQLTGPAGEPVKATYIFTMAILGLIQNRKPDMLVVAMDSKAPPFRREIYHDYKANRPPMPDDMPDQIDRIEQILDAMRVPVLRAEGFEADDIIGTISTNAAAAGIDTYICSKDKDMLQLLGDHVYTFDMKTGTQIDRESMIDDMAVSPEQFVDVLALQGDTADNVPGVPDVGPKTALAWIRKYGSLDNLYAHADEIKGKRGDNLRSSKELVALTKELVTINTQVPLEIDYDLFRLKKFDKSKLTRLFTDLGFNRLLTKLGLTKAEEPQTAPAPTPKNTFALPETIKAVRHEYRLIDTQEQFDELIAELKKQKLFAFDTETTSIQPCRADLVGISFCWIPHKAFYLPVRGPLGAKYLDRAELRKKLQPIMADEKINKVGQNVKFDLIVMQNARIPVKGVCFDTMVASYCLDPLRRSHSMDSMALDYLNYEAMPISALIGKGRNQLTFDMVDTAAACEYAAEDADITFQLYQYLSNLLDKQADLKRLFEEVEMPLVSVLAGMEVNGVSLDTKLLKQLSSRISDELETVSERIYELAGSAFNLDSPKQLAEILFDRLNLRSVRSGKAGRSTDAAVLEQLIDRHPIVELVLQYRTLSKLRNTYVDKLGQLINPRTSRVHASFNQTVTATGRLSSSDPNLQNIPVRTELGKKIRSAFVPADRNDCILSADYSQIELRLLAHFSKDQTLLHAFAEDRDIHRFVASQIYGVPLEEVTGEMRSNCKAVNFGIIYGQGAFGLARSIGISQAEAKKFIEDYFARYGSIRKFMDETIESARRTGYAETILHRRRKIPNLNSRNANKRAQAQRMAVNTVVQGSAADLIKVAMINIQRKIDAEELPVKMILQIHDELVFELPTNQAEQHAKWIAEEMTDAIKLDVPLKVDITHGPNWLGD